MGSQGRALSLRSAFELRQITGKLKQLTCDVVFGSPSADCRGTGVCKISALASMTKLKHSARNCQSAPGILYPLDGGAGVSIVIAREMMCLQLLRNQFRSGILTLNEPYRLSNDVTSTLSLKIKELKPGNYSIEEIDGFFRINFR